MNKLLEEFEAYLRTVIDADYKVDEAMNYSLLARSKRVRPMIMLNVLSDLGLQPQIGFAAAAALEMMHTASLIHDDLPAFDDDDMRRGRPSNHIAFDEPTAILAGDALMILPFEIISRSDYESDIKVELIRILAECAGYLGMIKGQYLDMEFEKKQATAEQLAKMDALKTARLLEAAITMGLAIGRDGNDYQNASEAARDIGIGFQIQDDLLDQYGDQSQTGKSASDAENEKSTYLTLLGKDRCEELVKQLYTSACEKLTEFPHLRSYLNSLMERNW